MQELPIWIPSLLSLFILYEANRAFIFSFSKIYENFSIVIEKKTYKSEHVIYWLII
ncbi:hypothetical protein RhiirA4_476544 [Rhizophagus irregularis]|uniref:Uncharacterized protein n=1 Tax=Rhizophagus irregularis TaxID=588596 RepID=A0A2I1HBP9_9GLOM|nr:hypothetical protein RhiirA4_476544 [Rhizophagus irregularis]